MTEATAIVLLVFSTATVAVEARDQDGTPVDVTDVFGSDEFQIDSQGTLAIESGDSGENLTGSLAVSSDHPFSVNLRLSLQGGKIAGIVGSPEFRSATIPVRHGGGITPTMAIRNVELAGQEVELTLRDDSGRRLATETLEIEVQGMTNAVIAEIFSDEIRSRFQGSLVIAAQAGRVAITALEWDDATGVYTTMPVSSEE